VLAGQSDTDTSNRCAHVGFWPVPLISRSGVTLVCSDENVCRGHSAGKLTALRHALTVGFANRLARRLDRHNGYKTLGPAPVCPSVVLMSK
jgi:hypothetical protein